MDSFERFLTPIILFNLSVAFLGISIIFFLIPFLELDVSIANLEVPTYLTSRKGTIKLGRILKGKTRKYKFCLSIKDLEKHMFICGATGTGKSNFLQNFLINFTKHYKIPFFLVEFKGEYHFLQKKIKDMLILWPGENFSINIFNPEDSNPIIHAERIFDILKSGRFLDDTQEFSPQMENVLVKILVKVCQNKKFQSWKGFEYYCEQFLVQKQKEIPMLSQTLISIRNRIRRFSSGPLRALFEKNAKIEMSRIFKRNIILDLSSIIRLGGEKEDALFFLNLILKYLWDKNLTQGAINYKGIKHLTIVEDAQYFAPQNMKKKSKITTYLEDIALLQRGTGECLVTLATRPDISKSILANNGVVLTFKNHMEKDLMCELLNLDLKNKNYLSILEEGQCIVRVNSIKEPFLLEVPYIKRESQKLSEINRRNNLILKKWQNFVKSEKNAKVKKKKKRKIFANFKQVNKLVSNLIKKIKLKLRGGINILREKEDNKNLKINSYINLENDNKESHRKDCQKLELKRKLKQSVKARKKNQRKINILDSFRFQEQNKSKMIQQFNSNKLKLDEILTKYNKIENLYKTNSFSELLVSCENIINTILEKISLQLGFKYNNIDQFLKSLCKLKLKRNFIFYRELIEYREFSSYEREKIELFIPEIAVSIFSITKRIINKLKSNWIRKKNNNFSTAYDNLEIKPLNVCNYNQSNKLLKNNFKINNQNSNCDPEQNDFMEFKTYVNELFKEQKKINKS
ncbi:MAG: ATP-binding protein [Promethearchaeota archaeon]